MAVGAVLLAGCGDGGPATTAESGVTGLVTLGPQCPVVTTDTRCSDRPAAGVAVTVSDRVPGDSYAAGKVVAQARTSSDGVYRIAVGPGEYVVTAVAGMSCELMDARVTPGSFSQVDIPCDTGIR